MKTSVLVWTSAAAALTSTVSGATLILPIGQTLDNTAPGFLIQDPEGGGLGYANSVTGEGIGIGSVPSTFSDVDITALVGSGAPLAFEILVGSNADPDSGGMADVTPAINEIYIVQISAGDTCSFNEAGLITESGIPYPGKVAVQDLTAGEHFFNYRVTRLDDNAQFFGFVKYTSNPDFSMNVISAGFNTTAGEAAVCPDGSLGWAPAGLAAGLVALRGLRNRRAAKTV